MALTLYTISGSVFAWRVHLTLEYKRLPYTARVLSGSQQEHKAAAFLAINPHGKVPALTDDDFSLYESAAICEYLEERFPDSPRLFPADVRARAIVRRTVCEVDSILAPEALVLGDNLYFKSPANWNLAEIAQAQRRLLSEIARLEGSLNRHFLCGSTLSAADFACYPFFAHMRRYERKKPDLGLLAALGPKLDAWLKRIETLPCFDATYPAHWR